MLIPSVAFRFLGIGGSPNFFLECYNIWMDFPTATIKHCDREANQVTHELARETFVSKAYCIWAHSPPSFIFPILSNDVTL
jgi:hypothetical protein